MRNKYPGKCFKCSKPVKEGEGFFQRGKTIHGKGIWLLRCKRCVGSGNKIIK